MVCPYFGKCGGCAFQDVDYSEQIKRKEEFLNSLFGFDISVIPSDSPLHYRNRMDFVCAFGKIGLRKKGDFKTVVDIDECSIFSEKGNKVLKNVRNSVLNVLEFYDFIQHKGYLKYIVIRTGEQTMVNFVTNDETPGIESVVETIDAESIWWTINRTKSDTSYGEKYKYWGSEHIIHKIGEYSFLIGPTSFFQTNGMDIIKPYSMIKEFVEGFTLDLYSGVGTIGIFVSERAEHVVCIEKDIEAVDLSKKNIEINRVENVSVVKGDLRTVFLTDFENVDTIIVDPPRPGLGKKVVKKILLLQPKKIIYMSCNPRTQKQDIEFMKGYEIEEIQGYDLFPQTPHVETVAVLSKE